MRNYIKYVTSCYICHIPISAEILWFLADCTNGRAYATVLSLSVCPSVVCL